MRAGLDRQFRLVDQLAGNLHGQSAILIDGVFAGSPASLLTITVIVLP
ncbi:MAG: hypothetical protein ACXWX7_12900 [Candidatus Binatia bacterium]